MATFILVPGAWCGGWAWKWVTPLLSRDGHAVYPITLTGLGERRHLAHPEIDLDTHIQDVVSVIEYEDLSQCILVGWSYGGTIITGVADRIPERVQQMIYLDGRRPKHNETVTDEADPWWQARKQLTIEQGAGWQVPIMTSSWEDPTDDSGYIPNETIRTWCINRVVPQPIKTFTQPIVLKNSHTTSLPFTFIVCTQGLPAEEDLGTIRLTIENEGGIFRELATHHLCLWAAPELTASAILDAVM